MAKIDKTFISNWNDIVELKQWLKENNQMFTDRFGHTFNPNDWINNDIFDISEKNTQIPNFSIWVWNTPVYFDYWLMENCPVKCIQDRLKVQYGYNLPVYKTAWKIINKFQKYPIIFFYLEKWKIYKRGNN